MQSKHSEEETQSLTLLISKLLQNYNIETLWFWHKDRYIGQWGYNQAPRNKPIALWLVDFQEGCQDHSMRKNIQQMVKGQLSTFKSMNLDSYQHYTQKINSRWNKDLKVRGKTMKTLDGNIGMNLHNHGLGNSF